jgi:hypothetical protein
MRRTSAQQKDSSAKRQNATFHRVTQVVVAALKHNEILGVVGRAVRAQVELGQVLLMTNLIE